MTAAERWPRDMTEDECAKARLAYHARWKRFQPGARVVFTLGTGTRSASDPPVGSFGTIVSMAFEYDVSYPPEATVRWDGDPPPRSQARSYARDISEHLGSRTTCGDIELIELSETPDTTAAP